MVNKNTSFDVKKNVPFKGLEKMVSAHLEEKSLGIEKTEAYVSSRCNLIKLPIRKKVSILRDDAWSALCVFPDYSIILNVAEKAFKNLKNILLPNLKNCRIAENKIDLINSYWLRSFVYNKEGYGSHFDVSCGFEFDDYDKNSVTFLFENENGFPIASSRVVFDDKNGLPSEKYCNFDVQREYGRIAEPSRMVVMKDYRKQGINKTNLAAIHKFGLLNNIHSYVFGVPDSHLGMYEDLLNGFCLIKENVKYGDLPMKLSFFSWMLLEESVFN